MVSKIYAKSILREAKRVPEVNKLTLRKAKFQLTPGRKLYIYIKKKR